MAVDFGRCAESVDQASRDADQTAADGARCGQGKPSLEASRKEDLPSEVAPDLPFLDRCDEAVAMLRNGLDETRTRRIVAKQPAEACDALA